MGTRSARARGAPGITNSCAIRGRGRRLHPLARFREHARQLGPSRGCRGTSRSTCASAPAFAAAPRVSRADVVATNGDATGSTSAGGSRPTSSQRSAGATRARSTGARAGSPACRGASLVPLRGAILPGCSGRTSRSASPSAGSCGRTPAARGDTARRRAAVSDGVQGVHRRLAARERARACACACALRRRPGAGRVDDRVRGAEPEVGARVLARALPGACVRPGEVTGRTRGHGARLVLGPRNHFLNNDQITFCVRVMCLAGLVLASTTAELVAPLELTSDPRSVSGNLSPRR